jgi:excisionase family DNA binding protein
VLLGGRDKYYKGVEGEMHYYSVEEAARVLKVTPGRIQEMLVEGELEGITPEEGSGRGWKIPLRVVHEAESSPPRVEVHAEKPPVESGGSPEFGDAREASGDHSEDPSPPANQARGDAATIREPSAPSGWVTTQQAARALGISPRTVRWHIERGNLEAKPEGEGVKRAWLLSIDSVQAFRDARQTVGESPGAYRSLGGSADIAAESPGSAIRELADRLVEEAARASEFRVRLELSERAQSTLEAELAEERRRREEAERERDELRRRLENAQGPRESPQRPSAEPERAEPRSGAGDPLRDAARRWRMSVFGR